MQEHYLDEGRGVSTNTHDGDLHLHAINTIGGHLCIKRVVAVEVAMALAASAMDAQSRETSQTHIYCNQREATLAGRNGGRVVIPLTRLAEFASDLRAWGIWPLVETGETPSLAVSLGRPRVDGNIRT